MTRPFFIGKRWKLALVGVALFLSIGAAGIAMDAGGAMPSAPDGAYSCHVIADGGLDWSTMPPRPTYMWLPCEDTLLRDAWRDA